MTDDLRHALKVSLVLESRLARRPEAGAMDLEAYLKACAGITPERNAVGYRISAFGIAGATRATLHEAVGTWCRTAQARFDTAAREEEAR